MSASTLRVRIEAALRDDRLAVAAIALLALAAHLLTIHLYGFHRDELYLIVSGRQLGGPGVNHATPTVLLARAADLVGGLSPFAQRIPDTLFGMAVVVLTGACARRLSGGRGAQVLAALVVATGPIFFFSAGVHGTNAPDQLCWALTGWIFLGFFDLRSASWLTAPRRWELLGGIIGLGFLTKATVLICAAGLVAAMLATQLRSQLRTAGPWIGAAIALLFLVPTAIWQQRHGWPLLEFIADSNAAVRRRTPTAAILLDQARLLHPVGLALAAIGVVSGLRRGASAGQRAAAVWFVTVLVAVLALHGKPYYVASAAPLAIAAGSIACARWLSSLSARTARALLAGWLVSAAATLAGTVPLLPAALQERLQLVRLNPELIQFADWNNHVAQIADAYRRAGLAATPGAAILTESYGTASAVDLLGAAHGLPRAISGGNDFFYWTAGVEPQAVLALGYSPALLSALFDEVTEVATIRGVSDHDNRFDFPRVAYACRHRKRALSGLWADLRRFD